MNFQPFSQSPLKVSTSPKPTSVRTLVLIFVAAFVIILIILNAPTIIKSIAYPFTHSAESDNEQLTQQYRDIYGYEKHPELITAVQNANNAQYLNSSAGSGTTGQYQFEAAISIPKINVSAPVIQVSDSSDSVILEALKKGVVLYPGSSNPGQPGTTVIIGHSSSNLPWTTYSSVFSLLGKLKPDDLIYITVGDTQYTYRIRAVQKGSAQQLIDSGLTGDLIVSTCWPIGTDANRIAVSASWVQ